MTYMLGSRFLYLAKAPKSWDFLMMVGDRLPLSIIMSCSLRLESLKGLGMGVLYDQPETFSSERVEELLDWRHQEGSSSRKKLYPGKVFTLGEHCIQGECYSQGCHHP